MRRMTRTMEHSEFVDGLESVLRSQCDVSDRLRLRVVFGDGAVSCCFWRQGGYSFGVWLWMLVGSALAAELLFLALDVSAPQRNGDALLSGALRFFEGLQKTRLEPHLEHGSTYLRW